MRSKATVGAAGRVASHLTRTALVTAAVVVVATGLPATTALAAPPAPSQQWQEVVVTGSAARAAADAVTAAGGQVLAHLPVVQGVAARLPVGTTLGPDWVVAPQRELRVAAASDETAATTATTVRQTLGLPADGDEGSGVRVAVMDTGIADVADLRGRVVKRVDLSGSGNGDGYGHGTFMAGLIAGSGAASGGAYRGVAPAASLVDVKVADSDGSTDLITVLRGLEWVSRNAGHIDVLNLSLSSYSPLPYQIDPLTQALEALWRRGITVVVPSGNSGPDAGTVTSPGSDPLLLTAGGLDAAGTVSRADDVVGTWSGRGPTWQGDAKPDLVAPGGHVVGLRAPGSVVDTANPQARIGEQYFRGSGTSMATAVTSGVVAAVLAEQPDLRPTSVKALLTGTTYAADGFADRTAAGAGGLDAAAALAAAPGWRGTPAETRYVRDTSAIRADATRWAALERAILSQDGDAAEAAWNSLSSASRDWAARTWAGLDPAARTWAARTWAARTWAGAGPEWVARTWAARTWAARTWASLDPAARTWAARTWASLDLAARTWASETWAARTWAGRTWADTEWSARTWAETRWSARSWAWLR